MNSIPVSQVTAEDVPLVFSAAGGNPVSISDADAGSNPVIVTLTATNGALTWAAPPDSTFGTGDGLDDPTMTFVGTVSDINAALEGLTFTPTLNYLRPGVDPDHRGRPRHVSARAASRLDRRYGQHHGQSVNDPPVNTVPPVQFTDLDTPVVFSVANGNRIAMSDADIGGGTAQVTLTATSGTMSLSGTAGLTFSSGDGTNDATMTFTGTVANLNNALNGLTFTPTAGFAGGATLTIVTNDLGSSGAGGASDRRGCSNDRRRRNAGLWLSTEGNVSRAAVYPAFTTGAVAKPLQFGDPDLNFEPGTTDGTLSSVLDLGRFTGGGSDGGMDALHYVSKNITVGGVNGTFNLQRETCCSRR